MLLIVLTIVAVAFSAPLADRITLVPGYSNLNTKIYGGYLDVKNSNRSLYYIFVESVKGANNSDPVTLWLNGGPGCSSLLGFLQQIGPFYLEDGAYYRQGDLLTKNKYSWHLKSNLLFIQSPAGVGYSINSDKNYIHTDAKTANDNLNALLDFFTKYPQYRKNPFLIAGQSYAGKYIPDLAVLIDLNNQYGQGGRINLKTILVGNGVMTFQTLQASTYEYMIDRRFVDPQIVPLYETACQSNPSSQACKHFKIWFQKGTAYLNPYNIYDYCFYNDSFSTNLKQQKRIFHSQESILEEIKQKLSKSQKTNKGSYKMGDERSSCSYFDGVFNYFNLNYREFNSKVKMWNGPCATDITYVIDPEGSISAYRHLTDLYKYPYRSISMVLYNGNWDAVVPFIDTLKGIKILGLKQSYIDLPWFTNQQHSGFQRIFQGMIFITVKGGSHQVPQSKRAEAFNLFDAVLQTLTAGNNFENGVFGKKAKKTKLIQI